MRKRYLIVTLGALAVVVGAVALAQSATDTGVQASLAELRGKAQRLTALAQVPADARPEAQALLDRADALRASAQELEVERLQAYIAALEAGDSPAVATQSAAAQVSEKTVELTRQQEALRTDVEAFLADHPEAASALRIRSNLLGNGGGSGPGDGAYGFGGHMGGHMGSPGASNGFGDMRHAAPSPQGQQQGQQPGQPQQQGREGGRR